MDYEARAIEYGHVFAGAEVRAVEERGEDFVLKGVAAVFDKWTDLGPFREKIAPGAFRSALPKSDVRLLVNHEGLPFARTSSGTMNLKETRQGLEVEARLSRNDPDVMALVPKIERGDLSQFSFAFNIGRDGQTWDGDDRTLTDFSELFDVSLVTFPAYEDTKVTALRTLRLFDLSTAESELRESRLRSAMLHGMT